MDELTPWDARTLKIWDNGAQTEDSNKAIEKLLHSPYGMNVIAYQVRAVLVNRLGLAYTFLQCRYLQTDGKALFVWGDMTSAMMDEDTFDKVNTKRIVDEVSRLNDEIKKSWPERIRFSVNIITDDPKTSINEEI